MRSVSLVLAPARYLWTRMHIGSDTEGLTPQGGDDVGILNWRGLNNRTAAAKSATKDAIWITVRNP